MNDYSKTESTVRGQRIRRALKAFSAGDRSRHILLWIGVLGGYAALLLAVYHRVWWSPPKQQLFFGWDCTRVYWQDLVFAINALADGELPLWNPYMALGYSFFSEPQTGLYSPLNWVLYGLGWVTGSRGPWLIQAKVLLTFWLGLVGMHLWIHRRHGSHLVAAFAAVTFALGSPLLVFKNSSLAWPILYLPWALLALEAFVARPGLRRAALLAGGVWLCAGAGSPQGFFFCALVLCPYYLFLTLSAPKNLHEGLRGYFPALGRSLRAQLPGLGVALLLVALLLAPVYVPAWQAMPYTPRESRSLAFLLAQPHTWGGLEELLLAQRDRNWFLDLYLGAGAVLLGAFALISATRRTLPRILFWLGLTAVGILLSLGEHTPLLPWLLEHVPGFDLFRIPYRYKLLFVIGIIALAAEGLAALLRRPLPPWQRLVWAALAGAWILYAALAATGNTDPRTPIARAAAKDHLWRLAPALLLLALVPWLWSRREALEGPAVETGADTGAYSAPPRMLPRWAWALPAVALGFVVADLWAAGQEKVLIMERPPRHDHDRRLYARLPGLRSSHFRIFQYPSHLSAMNLEVRELGGYTTFPMRLKRFDDLIRVARHDRAFLRHFNVRWVHAGIGRHLLGRLPSFAHRRGWDLLELKDPAPLLQVFPGYEVVPPGRALGRLRRPGPLPCALLEPGDAEALPSAAGPPGQGCAGGKDTPKPLPGRLLRYGRNRLLFEVRAPRGGIAVINEPYFPGWTARLDGRPVPLVQANHLLRAVYVPPGTHRLELRYQPKGYRWLLAGFLLGLLGLLGLLLAAPLRALGKRLHDRRRPADVSPPPPDPAP